MKLIKASVDEKGRPVIHATKLFGLVKVKVVAVDKTLPSFWTWRDAESMKSFIVSEEGRFTAWWKGNAK